MLADKEEILKAVTFRTSRSGGSGGQNVNKVSSKVELILNINEAPFLSDEEKLLLHARLASRLDKDGNLHVVSQEDRSQLTNKTRTVEKLIDLLEIALHVDKFRKPTKIPRSLILKRKSDKKSLSVKKELRKKPGLDH